MQNIFKKFFVLCLFTLPLILSINYLYSNKALLLCSLLILPLLFVFECMLNKKVSIIIHLIVGGILIFVFVAFYDVLKVGFKIFFNEVFALSEAVSTYQYQYLNVDVISSVYNKYITFFLIFLDLVLAYFMMILLKINLKFHLINILCFICFFLYFQLFNTLRLVLISFMFSVFVYLFKYKKIRLHKLLNKKHLFIILLFMFLIVTCLFYKPLSSVSKFNDSVRDTLTTTINQDGLGDEVRNDSSNYIENTTSNEAVTNVSYLPIPLIILGGLFSLIVLSPVFYLLYLGIKKIKIIYYIKHHKSSKALKLMLNYILKLSKVNLIKESNLGYINYCNYFKLYNKDDCFKELVTMYEEIYYGNKQYSDEEYEKGINIFNDLVKTIYRNYPWFIKLKTLGGILVCKDL